MNDEASSKPQAVFTADEPLFDLNRSLLGDPLPEPFVYDCAPQALRQRGINFIAKRYVDMMFVTGLDRATADDRFRWSGVTIPGPLSSRRTSPSGNLPLEKAHRDGALTISADPTHRRVTVTWRDDKFGPPVVSHAIARPSFGGILLGPHTEPKFDARLVKRRQADPKRAWPLGDGVETGKSIPSSVQAEADTLFANSRGLYGVLIASPDRILFERYGEHGRPDRPTVTWSVTKSVTATLIARLIHMGWLGSVHDPAPAPLWKSPVSIHRQITLDHLLRMRSGIAVPVFDGDSGSYLGFENSGVYQNAGNAFETAQRSIVATTPGAVFRYVNSGINVLGSIIRDQIESRGLPYYETLYEILADRLGMTGYQHSADLYGNLIGSGAGFCTLRDYAKFGVLYLQDGIWDGERILPEGWVNFALTPTHTGAHYAACFRTNTDRMFPDLPIDTAWALGSTGQRVFIMRSRRMVVSVSNELDHPLDVGALNRLIAAAIDAQW